MSKVIVMFDDDTHGRIISFFGSPQSPDDYPNMGEVDSDDPLYLDFLKRQSGEVDESKINSYEKDRLLGLAALRIAPLQYAKDLEMISAAESKALIAWMRYSVQVNRVDISGEAVEWPEQPK